MSHNEVPVHDLFIIGGGINGCGIARDAAGRGLSVALAEMNDLASATSSSSTKLFHGGLRYLEFFEFRLVREALIEREVLLKAMPHISWPLRFVLPYHKDMRFDASTPTSRLISMFMPWMKGRRPQWLIRLGLFIYDHLGGRNILPSTSTVDVVSDEVGLPLQDRFKKAYEYSDCWVDDARLVVLNARDAAKRGAQILTRTQVLSASCDDGIWQIKTRDTESDQQKTFYARMLVNAGGPWVGDIIQSAMRLNSHEGVRLVRGSHIVTRKLYDHDKCYFFQGEDGRIIFSIPYERDFTLIGTTDADHIDISAKPQCTPQEEEYLLNFANQYFKQRIKAEDVVWKFSGVRPLYDDGAASATAATRDYTLKVDSSAGAPALNIFGGKITTYRRLAESAMEKISQCLEVKNKNWTAGVALPGGNFPVAEVEDLVADLRSRYEFLDDFWVWRLVRAYGTDTYDILGSSSQVSDLGRTFGASLTEAEVSWLVKNEFARTAEDVIWRRSKLGLRLANKQIQALDDWMVSNRLSACDAAE